MLQSSGMSMFRVERTARGDERPRHVDAPAGEGDDRLVVALPLLPLAVVEGTAERVAERTEGGLVEDPLQPVVSVAWPHQAGALSGLAQHRREACGRGQGGGGSEAA